MSERILGRLTFWSPACDLQNWLTRRMSWCNSDGIEVSSSAGSGCSNSSAESRRCLHPFDCEVLPGPLPGRDHQPTSQLLLGRRSVCPRCGADLGAWQECGLTVAKPHTSQLLFFVPFLPWADAFMLVLVRSHPAGSCLAHVFIQRKLRSSPCRPHPVVCDAVAASQQPQARTLQVESKGC